MAIQDYFQTHYVQEYTDAPTGYPEPFNTAKQLIDGRAVQGRFIQGTSNNAVIAAAEGVETRGRFACNVDADIQDKDILRRESDDARFVIIGKPFVAPAQASSQFKYYVAKQTQERGG